MSSAPARRSKDAGIAEPRGGPRAPARRTRPSHPRAPRRRRARLGAATKPAARGFAEGAVSSTHSLARAHPSGGRAGDARTGWRSGVSVPWRQNAPAELVFVLPSTRAVPPRHDRPTACSSSTTTCVRRIRPVTPEAAWGATELRYSIWTRVAQVHRLHALRTVSCVVVDFQRAAPTPAALVRRWCRPPRALDHSEAR